jgi:hypothetical protein
MSSGSLVGTGHFDLDHDDITYETDYLNRKIKVAVDVQVTQHVGADSDRWLLHEMEDAFRDPDNLEESPAEATLIRQLFGNRIFFYGGGIVAYRWPSSSTVVNIQYSNFTGPKPEPLEIVQAYLKKFPSTLRPTLILGKTHDQEWIKSEMERRLWLCKKWFQHYQAGKVKLSVALHEVAAHAEIFLNYREKYYKKKADKDIRALSEYLYSSDATNINNRLESYTRWWNANKHRIIKVR